MTDLKTSQETAATALSGTELVRIVQSGLNAAASINQVKTYVNSFPAAAGTLTGTTLASNVVTSSLTSVGTLITLTVSGHPTFEGVTSTGATGTGKFVYSISPTLTGTTTAATLAATTINTFTLGGQINGGGNTIDNIVIGGGTNLTGAFTALTASTALITPIVVAGGGAGLTLTIRSTSGVGTTDSIVFQTGSQVTRQTILSNGKIGMGTETNPQVSLVVSSNVTTGIVGTATTPQLRLVGPDGSNAALEMVAYDNGTANLTNNFFFAKSSGTAASQAATVANGTLGQFGGRAWNGSAWTGSIALIQMLTNNQTSGSDTSSYIVFKTTPTASLTVTEAMRIQSSGGLSIGTTTDPGIGSLIVNGSILHPTVANAAIATALTSVGPTGSHTTVQEWFPIKNSAGTVRYVPGF